jgi:hypothetical protein
VAARRRAARSRSITTRALAELELAWSDGGYHGFTAAGGTWCAVTSAGEVLTGATPDELAGAIRAHWQAMRG